MITEKTDVWTFSCVAVEMFSEEGIPLLDGDLGYPTSQVACAFQMLGGNCVNDFPEEFRRRFKELMFADKFYDGEWNQRAMLQHWGNNLEECLKLLLANGTTAEKEAMDVLVSLYQKGLKIDPVVRASMAEILKMTREIWEPDTEI